MYLQTILEGFQPQVVEEKCTPKQNEMMLLEYENSSEGIITNEIKKLSSK